MEDMVIAYLEKNKMYSESILLINEPKNIANFIARIPPSCKGYITNVLDMPILSTFGNFINTCEDKEYLAVLLTHLVPMQRGEIDAFSMPLKYTVDRFYFNDEDDIDFLNDENEKSEYLNLVKNYFSKEFKYIL